MKRIVKLKESDLNHLVKRVMKEGFFDKKTNPLKELERDVKRAMFQKVAFPETTGVQGVWDHKEREKSMEEILDDLQDVIDQYKKM
jgi:hypothetical protein